MVREMLFASYLDVLRVLILLPASLTIFITLVAALLGLPAEPWRSGAILSFGIAVGMMIAWMLGLSAR